MDKDKLQTIQNKITNSIQDAIQKAKSKGIHQVEIFASYGNGISVTIEKNDIQALDSYEETIYGVRVIENYCEGFVTTNGSQDLIEAIEEAKNLALAQNTQDEARELPPSENHPTPPIDSFDESLYGMDEEKILHYAKKILDYRESNYPKVSLDSAGVNYGFGLAIIGSSNGILRMEGSSSLDSYFFGMAIDGDDIGSFDSEEAMGYSIREFEEHLDLQYDKFLKSCMSGLGAKTIPGFKGYVFLPPDAVYPVLLGGFISSLSATAIRMNRSKMAGKIGSLVTTKDLTITAEPTNPQYFDSTSFDREGQNTRDITVVENGILQNYFYNHYEAKKVGLQKSNGFASGGAGSPPGCGAKLLQIAPGKESLANLEDPGRPYIYVKRFSGTSSGVTGDFSGVVKGGFLVDKGEKIPIKEIQITGNIYDILKNQIAGISKERELLGKSNWVPSILLDGISIVGHESN